MREQGTAFDPKVGKTTRYLSRAIEIFDDAVDEMGQRFPKPEITEDHLARLLWFNFYDLSAQAAEQDAASISVY